MLKENRAATFDSLYRDHDKLENGSHRTLAKVLVDQTRPPSARESLIKAAADYFLGAIALAIFAPAMVLIGIAIKSESPGPIFFVQRRHGLNQRIIRVFKFRTMTVTEDGPVVTQAVREDKRVTRVGRFLRRTSLDELPQLINVLRGDLSLVGPRPHALAHNEYYAGILTNYTRRHQVKPGITGLAQVNGCRGGTNTPAEMRKRVDLDLHYIKNWSLWMDIKILFKTLTVPFNSPNAY
jgi:putative colanic acid biosysnthesis UDP-glucose lipid carrier transferase